MDHTESKVNSSQPIGEPLNDMDEVSSDFTDEEEILQ